LYEIVDISPYGNLKRRDTTAAIAFDVFRAWRLRLEGLALMPVLVRARSMSEVYRRHHDHIRGASLLDTIQSLSTIGAKMSMFRSKKLDLGCFINIKVIRDHTKRKVFEQNETQR
jgi:hypothetical protein